MVTGSEIGATSWLPPSRLSPPSVVTSAWWSDPPEPPPVVVASCETLSPITDTAFPPTVTGKSTGITPWLPPSRLSPPSVVTSPPEPEDPVEVVASEVPLSPMTDAALPPTVTGTSTGITA